MNTSSSLKYHTPRDALASVDTSTTSPSWRTSA